MMSDFEQKVVLAAVAVLVGWLLNEISSRVKENATKRQRISRSLALMFLCYSLLIRVSRSSEQMKDVSSSTEEYEKLRARVFHHYNNAHNSIDSELNQFVETFLDYFPHEADKANFLREAMSVLGNISMKTSSRSAGQIYIRILSVFEVAFDAHMKSIRKMIDFLSLRLGLLSYFRAKYHMHNIDKTSKSYEAGEYLADTFDEMRKAASQSEESSGDNVTQ